MLFGSLSYCPVESRLLGSARRCPSTIFRQPIRHKTWLRVGAMTPPADGADGLDVAEMSGRANVMAAKPAWVAAVVGYSRHACTLRVSAALHPCKGGCKPFSSQQQHHHRKSRSGAANLSAASRSAPSAVHACHPRAQSVTLTQAADCRLARRTRSVEMPTLTVRKAAILSGEAQIATSTHLPTHQPAWLRLFIPARSSSPPLVSITLSSPPLRSIRTRSAPQHHPHTLGAHLRSPSSLSAHHTLGHSAAVCIALYPHPHPRRLPNLDRLVASRAFSTYRNTNRAISSPQPDSHANRLLRRLPYPPISSSMSGVFGQGCPYTEYQDTSQPSSA